MKLIFDIHRSRHLLGLAVLVGSCSLAWAIWTLSAMGVARSIEGVYFLGVLALLPCNSLLLSRKLSGYQLALQWRMVCKGASMKLWMPLGLGAYAGCWYWHEADNRIRILELSIMGSLAQNAINAAIGTDLLLWPVPNENK